MLVSECQFRRMLNRWVVDFVILNITDIVKCSCGIYLGKGGRLCQRQSEVRYSEQTVIILRLIQLVCIFPKDSSNPVVELRR